MGRKMRRASLEVDDLLALVPADDPDKPTFQARVSAYRRDCGCEMGAAFTIGTLLLAIGYVALTRNLNVRTAIAGIIFVLGGSLLGKGIGLLLASAKLALVRRSIRRRIDVMRSDNVHVH